MWRREKWIWWVLVVAPGRAACRNTQQRAALNTDGFSLRVVWRSPSLHPQLQSQGRCTSANRGGLPWPSAHPGGIWLTGNNGSGKEPQREGWQIWGFP